MSRIFAIALALALTACGYKGPLEMPAGPAPEPLLGRAKTPPAATTNSDLSTDKKAPSQ